MQPQRNRKYFQFNNAHDCNLHSDCYPSIPEPLKEQDLLKIARRSDAFLEKFDENGPAPMYTETRKALYDFYKPYNNELGRLLIQRLNYNREEIWWEEETEIASFVPK